MTALTELSSADLRELHSQLTAEYDALVKRGLSLDITRGKPSPAQLDLSNALLTLPGEGQYRDAAGTDLRNYGGPQGLPELREIFSDVLRVPVPQLLALGNSSLSLMHDAVTFAMLHGLPESERPWSREETVSFLCPVPGYDRHFTITEHLGIRMVPVAMTESGPDIEQVERLLAEDPTIRGIWCVPVHSNPTGAIYTEEVARALVSLPAAADFRIFWDNAYAVHHLTDDVPEPIDILSLAAEAGNPDRVFVFASTSKVTYASAGVAFFGSSPANVSWYLSHLAVQSIGPDKINQLRHVRLLHDAEGVAEHMRRHREIIGPKFEAVSEVFERRLASYEAGSWTSPTGGYFVSLDVHEGCAARAVALAAQAGIAVTPAGSTYPYKKDPTDANIRIAPTMPPLAELVDALEGLCTAILLAEVEQLVG
ncbi:aminotransferase class I/II-fold pyridoxal phosphate-dependent enzyme [Humibacter ginsenosidimutans]|uniref:Aminotransferase class I/II-fold pyridoxal phosphate-dependent enzyme n=1 Tax=Humibacter ginsenosidimutans TaxID=2599293 RepID=A0A5B8M7J1_9MICO|nr:aminotransferase class I/II-fold pyridoxal phosphate-dependent enzyme [Humibacter ginsenosidimutans]QDZ15572.1 aminotransferase class I/II-fold pyridoxal phosphate-dependent enzyme [Humibacter ginsenosidimutans]